MKRILLALVALLFTGSLGHAADSTVVFPPQNCTGGSHYFSWTQGNASTECISAAQILREAVPNCTPGQVVQFDGSGFACITIERNLYGGIFSTNMDGSCRYANPLSGGCNCPGGYSAVQSAEFVAGNCTANGAYADTDPNGSGAMGHTTTCGIATFQCVHN